MSAVSFHIFLYWGPRSSTLEKALGQTIEHLLALHEIGPAFSNWVQLSTSRKRALANPTISPQDEKAVTEILIKGQNRTDTKPKKVIPELGYHVRLWNKALYGVDASTSIRCGVHSEFLSPEAQNTISLEFKEMGDGCKTKDVQDAFMKLASIWIAESGKVWRNIDGTEEVIGMF
jgi:hypothetical protein